MKWSKFILIAVLLFTSASVAQYPPEQNDERWLLAVIDVETTGLTPGFNEMIDMGLIYLDLDGNEIARLFERVWPEHLDRVQPGAVAVNGFSKERWDSLDALSKQKLADKFVALHDSVTSDADRVYFMAYNSWFDQSFVAALLEETGYDWRDYFFYIVLDIPSMGWQLGLQTGEEMVDKLGIEAETRDPLKHTGITGAEFNVNAYRALLQHRGK